jgi:hypothetical protein
MIFFLRVSVKNRNPYLKTSARRCCAGAFNSGVKGLSEDPKQIETMKQPCLSRIKTDASST